MKWQLVYTGQAQKDAKKLAASGLRPNAEALLNILKDNPFQNPPPYEKLVGDLAGGTGRALRPCAKAGGGVAARPQPARGR